MIIGNIFLQKKTSFKDYKKFIYKKVLKVEKVTIKLVGKEKLKNLNKGSIFENICDSKNILIFDQSTKLT